jgi:hypothetical protein
MTSLGIEPETFQLVAYATENHLCPKQSKIWPILKKSGKEIYGIIYSAEMSVQSAAL